MLDKNKLINKDYWEKNIAGFSGFYDKGSEEKIIAPRFLSFLYKSILFSIEKRYMRKRYDMVSDYIDRNVYSGMVVADIGCGSGVFVENMIVKGAKVYALDYAESALELAKKRLAVIENSKKIKFIRLDITKDCIPKVDLAIAIGVLTYINEKEKFFDNILPYTNKFLFNYLDLNHPINIFRKIFPVFDVRKLSYHSSDKIRKDLEGRGFKINRIHKLATGFVIDCERIS